MDTKSIFKSKTIWGVLVTVAGLLGFGDAIPADFPDTMVNVINQVLEVVGIVLTVYGRIVAKEPLSILGGTKTDG